MTSRTLEEDRKRFWDGLMQSEEYLGVLLNPWKARARSLNISLLCFSALPHGTAGSKQWRKKSCILAPCSAAYAKGRGLSATCRITGLRGAPPKSRLPQIHILCSAASPAEGFHWVLVSFTFDPGKQVIIKRDHYDGLLIRLAQTEAARMQLEERE
jgi:hypothetical protein